ncbi:MAG: hypothetical protein KME29_04985 [Calothrix sp. FI2-JRJ7]|jgi:hypothetical protein|nr:hypothetical protein [Calothrix sp. FI2-JRJ7]
MQHEKILEILESKSSLGAYFKDFYQSREEWALVLGRDRTSIWRWESGIIRLVFPILKEYQKSKFLDNYQRFILAIIHALKKGWCDGKKRDNQETKDWLKKQAPNLTREKFNNWINAHEQSE